VGKVVLVTGGTSGIGLSLAESFLEEGAAVAVCGRSRTALDRFSRAHPEALAVQADVTVPEARAAMLDAITERFGRLDVLVNNAGTFVERDFAANDDATVDLDQEIVLNLTAPIHLTGEVLRRWPPLDAIVFVTSGFALVSPTRAPTYGAVKAGLHGFADGLRRQLAPHGTHVLEVLPPTTDTPMNAHRTVAKLRPAEVAAVTQSTPTAPAHGSAGPDETDAGDATDRATHPRAHGRETLTAAPHAVPRDDGVEFLVARAVEHDAPTVLFPGSRMIRAASSAIVDLARHIAPGRSDQTDDHTGGGWPTVRGPRRWSS